MSQEKKPGIFEPQVIDDLDERQKAAYTSHTPGWRVWMSAPNEKFNSVYKKRISDIEYTPYALKVTPESDCYLEVWDKYIMSAGTGKAPFYFSNDGVKPTFLLEPLSKSDLWALKYHKKLSEIITSDELKAMLGVEI